MKYTIEGFNQRNAIAMKLSAEDLILLRWIIDFKEDGTMKKKYIPNINDMGYWISYKYVIQELPILFSMPPYISNEDYPTLSLDEKKSLNKKWLNACKKKIQRMLSGNLSKVLSRDLEKERTLNEKGQHQIKSKVYVYINTLTYKFLISDSCGLYVDNSKNNVDKHLKFTDGQKCLTENKSTGVQKCPSVTGGQKSPVYSSINILNSSTNTSENITSEKEQLENHPNIKILREKTNLKNKGRDFYKTIIEWDYDRLVMALDEYLDKQGYSFAFLRDIFNNLTNKGVSAINKHNTTKTKFHNLKSESFRNFTEDALEKHLFEMQANKFKPNFNL